MRKETFYVREVVFFLCVSTHNYLIHFIAMLNSNILRRLHLIADIQGKSSFEKGLKSFNLVSFISTKLTFSDMGEVPSAPIYIATALT